MSAHRASDPRRPGRVAVPTILRGFPQLATPAASRVRETESHRGEHYATQAARAAAWRADQDARAAGAR